jgi:hypothetical protein
MTEFFPSPASTSGAPFPLIPPAPAPLANVGVPTGITVHAAMALGYLPAQTQVTGFGNGASNPTIASLMSAGLISGNTLVSTLSFSSPSCNYGGN